LHRECKLGTIQGLYCYNREHKSVYCSNREELPKRYAELVDDLGRDDLLVAVFEAAVRLNELPADPETLTRANARLDAAAAEYTKFKGVGLPEVGPLEMFKKSQPVRLHYPSNAGKEVEDHAFGRACCRTCSSK
jgi:hypothetical protein